MPYEQAAQFLARVVPWPALQTPQPEWFINIHSPSFNTQTGKRGMGGRAVTTLREALNYIQWIDTRPVDPKSAWVNPGDLYVCMSAQQVAKAKSSKGGRVYYTAVRGAPNAILHKDFYIDLDVKPDGFPTAAAATKALGQFIEQVGLPMPSFIVASGSGGFHVHWTLADPVLPEVWLPISQALVTAMRAVGFAQHPDGTARIDVQCTTNPVQLLRIPDTFNHKHTPPKPVLLAYADREYQLERISEPLLTYMSTAHAPPRAVSRYSTGTIALPPGFGPISSLAKPQELVPNQQAQLPTLKELAKCCPFVEHAVLSGGHGFHQPLWYETAKLAFYTSHGVKSLIGMANLHDDYDVDENVALYDRIVGERTPVDRFGWPYCSTIEAAGATSCGACRWKIDGRTANRSPLHFLGEDHRGKPAAPTVPSTPPAQVTTAVTPPSSFGLIPDGYYFDAEGKVWQRGTTDDDGKDAPDLLVIPYSVKNFEVTMSPEGLQFEISSGDQRSWRPIGLTYADASDPRALARIFGGHGVPLRQTLLKRVVEFMPTWTETLQARRKETIPVDSCGWSWGDDGKPVAFSYGRTRYNCVGDRPAFMTDTVLQQQFTPMGQLEPWRRAMDMIVAQNVAALQVIVAAGFGAPFMEFTGEGGVMISARSGDSGRFKSSALKVSCSIFGHPVLGIQGASTINSVIHKMSTLKNFAAFWDEVHLDKDVKEVVALMFMLTLGKGKTRLTRSSEQMLVGQWATIMVAASNKSLQAMASDQARESNAPLYRVFEFDVPASTAPRNPDAQTILADLSHNYGHAGAVVAKWCGMNAAQVPALVQEFQKAVRIKLGAEDAERYWAAGIACILFGAQLANDLKLANFNIPLMYQFLEREFLRNRAFVNGSEAGLHQPVNVVSMISNFCNEGRHFLLRTDTLASGAGKPGAITSNILQYQKGTDVCGQLSDQPATLRLSQRVLRKWCKMNEFQADALIAEMVRHFQAEKKKLTLGAGTTLKGAQEWVIELNMNHAGLKGLFD